MSRSPIWEKVAPGTGRSERGWISWTDVKLSDVQIDKNQIDPRLTRKNTWGEQYERDGYHCGNEGLSSHGLSFTRLVKVTI